jgi:recombination protein RecT
MATNASTNSGGGPLQIIRHDLERMTSQFAMVMPADTVDRFKRIFVTMLQENPNLLSCTPGSLIRCAMRAAQDGLELDGREAACVPFKSGGETIAQYVPMILGIRKKVRQSGLVSDWNVQVVYEGDEFEVALGDRPYILHKPSLKGGRKRPIIGAYSIATFSDGTVSREFMNADEIEDIRAKSKSRQGPWADPVYYPEMARKTVARLHAKQLPMSSDLAAVFTREDQETGAVPPPAAPAPTRLRIGNVSHALDDFASSPSLSAPPQEAAAEGRARDDEPSQSFPDSGGASPGPGADWSDDVAPVPDDDPAELAAGHEAADEAFDARRVAYELGKKAKAANPTALPNRIIPGEYRSGERTREALAWRAGFDGQDMPA